MGQGQGQGLGGRLLLSSFPLQHLNVFPGLPDSGASLHQRAVGISFCGLCTSDSLAGANDAGILVVVAVEQPAGAARRRARMGQAVTTAVVELG